MPPVRSEVKASRWCRGGWGKFALLLATLLSAWTLAPAAAANGWEHGSIPLPVLIKGLKAEDTSTRQRSAEYLGRRGDPTAVAPLLGMLAGGERESSVRSAAYLVLGQLRDAQAMPGSREAAKVLAGENGIGDDDPRLRAAAARSLAVVGFEDAPNLLMVQLSDHSAEVRATVARVLGVLGDHRAVGPLVGQLADANSDVRREAARALGYLGDEVARDAFEQRLAAETTESVRATVRDAIALLSG